MKKSFQTSWSGQDLNIVYEPTTEEIVFTATVQDKSYLSVGLGEGMHEVDMILWLADGEKSAVYDMWSQEYKRPLIDEIDNNLNTISDGENGAKIFTTRRALNTGDKQDAVIAIDQELIWNYGLRVPEEPLYKDDTGLYKKHSQTGHFKINFS